MEVLSVVLWADFLPLEKYPFRHEWDEVLPPSCSFGHSRRWGPPSRGSDGGGKTSSHECRKVLLTLVLRPRVSFKNDTVGTGWAAAPPSFRVAAATRGPRPRGTTSSPFSHWIFCAAFFRSASARFEQFDVRRSASRAPHEIRPQRLASNDLCRCRVPESHPLRPPRTKPREIPALAPSFSPAPTDDGAPRGHFARAPTSPVVLRTIRDHFLCRSGTNSSNKMGVKWV